MSGAVVVGAMVLVATVARTKVAGDVVSEDYRIGVYGVGGCCIKVRGIGGCSVRLITDDVGRGGSKDLGHKIAP